MALSSSVRSGNALAAKVRLIVTCKTCQHRAEPDIAGQVERYGAAMTVIDWAKRFAVLGLPGAGG